LEIIRTRLRFLCRVGLGYLNLHRIASTLSAGEAQRIKLAGLLGSELTSLTVLLDEPSRGLHPSEVAALREVLLDLTSPAVSKTGSDGSHAGYAGDGNTVIMVEHDLDLIEAAHHIVDMGPGGGARGGSVVAAGSAEEVSKAKTTTGRWLREPNRHANRGRAAFEPRTTMTVIGARANNLCGETVCIPLGGLVGICGVSGSGKSTLLVDTVGHALAPVKHTTSMASEPLEPGIHDGIEGAPARVIVVDQATAGVTNPADFLGLTRPLRALFAESEDAVALDVDPKLLERSCSVCKGRGTVRLDMGFLPAVYAPCETCRGSGYLPEAWQIRVRGLALPEVMALTIDETLNLFGDVDALARPLALAQETGLGYLVLQQPRRALSGGEAQRLKIANELCRRSTSETLYILDEPTVGQHLEDVARLVNILLRLVDEGHSVVVSEHHPHLLAACDWLLELGPGGGRHGGRVIAQGTPADLARGDTPTAPYLRALLEVSP
jgi:excinuclease ABC subunit A